MPTNLKEGDHGPSVLSLQKLLKKNGTSWRFYYGRLDGDFGPNTGQAVRRAKYRLGYPKSACNEQAGRRLRELLRDPDRRGQTYKDRAAVRYKRDKARDEATSDMAGRAWDDMVRRLGHHETPPGSNHSPETEAWGHGNMAWCGVTVSLAYLKAGSKAFDRSSGKYQYVPAIVEAARSGNGLKLVSTPQHGDLVIWRTSSGAYGHVSMFGGWTDEDRDYMVEIGGNEGLQGVVKRDVSSTAYASAYVRVTA